MKQIIRCICIIVIFSFYCLTILGDDSQVPPINNNNVENITNSENDGIIDNNQIVNDLEPSVDVHASFDEEISEDAEIFNKQLFSDGTSQNSGIINEMTNNGPPVVVTLVDVATTELEQKAILPSHNNENTVSTSTITTTTTTTNYTEQQQQQINQTQLDIDKKDTLIVDEKLLKENQTTDEEIPSFSEWTQKRLEEAEKQKEPQNVSSSHHHHQEQQDGYNQQNQQQQSNGSSNSGKQNSGVKLRWKNYASPDCGAKVVASNPEAISPSAILSPSRDEYKLNKCTSRIWFIVELCEAIQAKKIDFANFELFSSTPKDFSVSVSDRFPTRDWINVGAFTAKDERDIQSFNLTPQLFGKYIKVEVKSHYGSEHYCPMSLFRVYGTSEFEVLQKEDVRTDRLEDDTDDDDDDDDGDDDETLDNQFGDSSKNLFSSATDAVLSMVKKAAEVVVGNKGTNNSNQTENTTILTTKTPAKYVPLINTCSSPSHLVVCDNCSDILFGKIFELLSCYNLQIKNLVSIRFIRTSLIHSNICQKFGFNFQKNMHNRQSQLIESFFPPRFLGAMCNYVAISENKVVLNISNQYTNNTKTDDEIVNIETSEPKIILNDNQQQQQSTDTLNLETNNVIGSKVTCSTDITYTSQIKPTKTITPDLNLKEILTESVLETRKDDPQEIGQETNQENHEIASEKDNNNNNNNHVTESNENFENLEHFISELNGDNHSVNVQPTTTTAATPQAQKESVFLRLLNRIKALERNMSLSSQYLEELSKRYKKQVEEMQKTLEKTVSTMTEDIKRKDEYNRKLEENLMTLTLAVENLIAEKYSWSSLITYITYIFLLVFFISSIIKRKHNNLDVNNSIEQNGNKVKIKRRKSIDVVQHQIPQKRRRRPSDQILKIVHSSSAIDTSKRKKRKKLKRSTSINTIGDLTKTITTNKVDWIETEAKRIDEIPFVLEDSEHSTLEPINLNNDNDDDNTIKSSNSKTADLRINGGVYQKSASIDETVNRHGISVNGSVVVVAANGHTTTPKKEKKGLKRILKKVF